MTPVGRTRMRGAHGVGMLTRLTLVAGLLTGALGCDGGGGTSATTTTPPKGLTNAPTTQGATPGACRGFDLYTADQVILHGIGLNSRAAVIVDTGSVDRYGAKVSLIAMMTMGGQVAVV